MHTSGQNTSPDVPGLSRGPDRGSGARGRRGGGRFPLARRSSYLYSTVVVWICFGLSLFHLATSQSHCLVSDGKSESLHSYARRRALRGGSKGVSAPPGKPHCGLKANAGPGAMEGSTAWETPLRSTCSCAPQALQHSKNSSSSKSTPLSSPCPSSTSMGVCSSVVLRLGPSADDDAASVPYLRLW